ncbi:MAG: DUF4982 domain-containing protein [Sedimentisphaerales bacterium]|nr:DUF4982 domain-containing protein [Sedimentisphaerales bacterium]
MLKKLARSIGFTALLFTSLSDFSVFGQTAKPAAVQRYVDFNADWLFAKGDAASAMMPVFDDASWRKLNVPHDWSIEGPFGPEYASGNGYAPGGIAWYRKHFTIEKDQQGRCIAVEFDGVYDHSQVYINGFIVAGRPYGYSSFQCDLTPYINFGSGGNVLAVRVDHSRFADSRWYTGSGIYRNVRLRITDKLHVAYDGIYVTTPEVKETSAAVRIETVLDNASGQSRTVSVQSEILDPNGRSAAVLASEKNAESGINQPMIQEIKLENPQLWSIESPSLYTLITRISSGGSVVDEVSTRFGIRTINFDANKGFSLNGKSVKLKGVCIHHDAGALGSAVPEKVLERRLRILQELGVNAIRTSHNPPAPELLDICDRIGLLVKDEAFDEFTPAKNKWVAGWNAGVPSRWGYAESFEQWAITDIQDMVRRDRNHPCIIMWSIGNEIDYANDPFSHPVLGSDYRPQNPPASELVRLGKPLIEAVRKLDSTRPVSAGLANMPMSDAVGLPDLLDAVGYNYQESLYASDHQKKPERVIFGSENNHQYNNWVIVRDNDYVVGQFLWTGIDYLGESGSWPNRGNISFGLLDTCGFKKPNAWLRQSLWSDKPMVCVCTSVVMTGSSARRRGSGSGGRGGSPEESWNRPEGSTVRITCYTNCEQVQLTVNDKLIGTQLLADAANGVLNWTIPYEAGALKAVGLKNGAAVCEYLLKTAGPASRIELVPDQSKLLADGRDICHIEFRITDDKGVRVPDAQNLLKFEISGPVRLLGIDNGEMTGLEDYRSMERRASRGRGLAILQSTTAAGRTTVTVTSPGLQPAAVELDSR